MARTSSLTWLTKPLIHWMPSPLFTEKPLFFTEKRSSQKSAPALPTPSVSPNLESWSPNCLSQVALFGRSLFHAIGNKIWGLSFVFHGLGTLSIISRICNFSRISRKWTFLRRPLPKKKKKPFSDPDPFVFKNKSPLATCMGLSWGSHFHPHSQPQNSSLRIFRRQPGLEWKFLLRRTCCWGKNCSHCSFQDFHSLSKGNQVSLVRTFLSEPGSKSKNSRLGGWGGKMLLKIVAIHKFSQLQHWERRELIDHRNHYSYSSPSQWQDNERLTPKFGQLTLQNENPIVLGFVFFLFFDFSPSEPLWGSWAVTLLSFPITYIFYLFRVNSNRTLHCRYVTVIPRNASGRNLLWKNTGS